MNKWQITHIGFSDESNWSKGRFRSIGLVTCNLCDLINFENEFQQLLKDSKISELQWKKLNNADRRNAAKKVCEFVLEKTRRRSMRIDVLIWDIEDSRHKIVGRDDIANLQRMYYHLFGHVMKARWPKDAVWCFRPDKHTNIDWMTIQACLGNIAVSIDRAPVSNGGFCLQLRREFRIEEINAIASSDHPPLLQIADLFAGMAVFSRYKFNEYLEWELTSKGQSRLSQFLSIDDNIADQCAAKLSNRDHERFCVLQYLDSLCKKAKLGVSLKKGEGLWTPNPGNPINFWPYTPQHPNDKAPLRI